MRNDSLDFTRIQYTRFNGKGTRLLCGSEYQLKPCTITIFDLPEKELPSADVEQVRLTSKDWHNPQFPEYDRPTAKIQDCCFAGNDDHYLVVAATGDENVYIWSVPDGKGKRVIDQELLVLKGHKKQVSALRYCSEKCILASSDVKGKINLWTPFKLPDSFDDDEPKAVTDANSDGSSSTCSSEDANYFLDSSIDSSSNSSNDE